MAKLDIEAIPEKTGSRYPAPFNGPCLARRFRRLGDAAGLTQLGVTRLVLPPGAWSSQRHWHSHEDEFMIVLEGEVVLVTDAGEELLRTGDCAAFKAGTKDGHHAQNRSGKDAVILAMGSHSDDDSGEYSDIDMKFSEGRLSGGSEYLHKDGTPY